MFKLLYYKWGNYEINKGTEYISVTKRSVVKRPIERWGMCGSEFVYFIIYSYLCIMTIIFLDIDGVLRTHKSNLENSIILNQEIPIRVNLHKEEKDFFNNFIKGTVYERL